MNGFLNYFEIILNGFLRIDVVLILNDSFNIAKIVFISGINLNIEDTTTVWIHDTHCCFYKIYLYKAANKYAIINKKFKQQVARHNNLKQQQDENKTP